MSRLTCKYDRDNVLKDMCTFDRESNVEADDCLTCSEYCNIKDMNCEECAIQRAIDKLAYYEDLEEQDSLLKMPCRAGDKLWWINRGVLIESEVINFVIDEDGMFIRVKYLNDKEHNYYYGCPFEFDDIGKIAFLTRGEAEKELERLNEQRE